MTDIVVIGAGPAGVLGALRAAELGARTVLVTSGEFGQRRRQQPFGTCREDCFHRHANCGLVNYGLVAD